LYALLNRIGYEDGTHRQCVVRVYYDKTAPGVADWKSLHFPSLQSAKALVVICTPGIATDLSQRGHPDWVYEELRWWARSRHSAPIVVDGTRGEGDRWLPALLLKKWPDINRIDVDPVELGPVDGPEAARVRDRIIGAINELEHRTVFEDLIRARRQQRRLQLLLAIVASLCVAVGGLWTVATRARRDAQERADYLLSVERGRDLDERGWGVVFTARSRDVAGQKLAPLLEHRKRAAGVKYLELTYRGGETARELLARYGSECCPFDPIPYYLLIVGSPEEIPFSVQYELASHRAVGRISFDDPLGYAAYASSILRVEAPGFTRPSTLTVFAPTHQFDRATQIAQTELIDPMRVSFEQHPEDWTPLRWSLTSLVGNAATKESLTRALGAAPPALFFTVSHGMWTTKAANEAVQGAFVCADWPGSAPVTPKHYFAAEDVPGNADLLGMIIFANSAYSAGVPKTDEFAPIESESPLVQSSDREYVAALPQALLGSNRGALAFIGHVDRNWVTSFQSPLRNDKKTGQNIGLFGAALRRLMNGYTVGLAMESFRQRHALLGTTVNRVLREAFSDPVHREARLRNDNISLVDVRNYIILGDPAVATPARLIAGP
jgi:hypothetical protein